MIKTYLNPEISVVSDKEITRVVGEKSKKTGAVPTYKIEDVDFNNIIINRQTSRTDKSLVLIPETGRYAIKDNKSNLEIALNCDSFINFLKDMKPIDIPTLSWLHKIGNKKPSVDYLNFLRSLYANITNPVFLEMIKNGWGKIAMEKHNVLSQITSNDLIAGLYEKYSTVRSVNDVYFLQSLHEYFNVPIENLIDVYQYMFSSDTTLSCNDSWFSCSDTDITYFSAILSNKETLEKLFIYLFSDLKEQGYHHIDLPSEYCFNEAKVWINRPLAKYLLYLEGSEMWADANSKTIKDIDLFPKHLDESCRRVWYINLINRKENIYD